MILTVIERLTLSSMLPPQKGDITNLRIMRKFREDLSFDEEENKLLDFHEGGEALPDGSIVPEGQIKWNPVAIEKDIEIGPVPLKAILAAIDRLGKMDALDEELLPFFERFVPAEAPPAPAPAKPEPVPEA